MRRFRYVFDPLCLVGGGLYALNRWVLAAWLTGPFWRGHFNDIWLIPAALPPVLWAERRLGLRAHDRPPGWDEILFHLLVWSVAAEWAAPRVFAHAVGDGRDVVAYGAGAIVAVGWWWPRRP